MSKIIRLTEEYRAQLRKDFDEQLAKARTVDGEFKFQRSFTGGKREATVYFTSRAWSKMILLLDNFNKEVAWHGFAERLGEEENDEYLISDIVVYPQEVTGTTVEMDEEAYAKWISDHIFEDERYFHFGMQGHSHVNMSTNPSGTDIQHQQDILDGLQEDGFYIFMIYNKRLEHNIRIFDMKKNVMFENTDVKVSLYEEGEDLAAFVAEAKSMVKDHVYTPPAKKTLPAATPAPKTQASSVASKAGSESKIGSGWRGKGSVKYHYDEDEDDWENEVYGYYSGYSYGDDDDNPYGYEKYYDENGWLRYRPKAAR